jgi:hypothetical protein
MRRFININFSQLVYRLLPSHKRLPKRLLLFRWPMSVLTDMFTAFKAWRFDVFYRINVTGQTLSLQNYLNYAVDNANGSILIQDYNDQGIWVQLSTEEGDSYVVDTSQAVENTHYIDVAINGEVTPLEGVDFYVYAPNEASRGDIARVVEKYKLAGKRYEIIQN